MLKVQRSGSCLFFGENIGIPCFDLSDLFLHLLYEGVIQEFLKSGTIINFLCEAELYESKNFSCFASFTLKLCMQQEGRPGNTAGAKYSYI